MGHNNLLKPTLIFIEIIHVGDISSQPTLIFMMRINVTYISSQPTLNLW
jgi:hypothetical protein